MILKLLTHPTCFCPLFMTGVLFMDIYLYYEIRVALVNHNGVLDFLHLAFLFGIMGSGV